jgi:hypothetical protein
MNYIREGTDKRKVFPVHYMKAYRGRRGRAPLFRIVDNRRRQVVNCTIGPFHLGERTPISHTLLVLFGLMTITIFRNKYKF